jgi:ssDNA-binding Zn-finger/Zn-ribbon topoisomerase 1
MLASDSGKPDRVSERVDEMTKESTPECGSEKLQRYWNQRY